MLNYVHVFSLLYAFVDLKTNKQTKQLYVSAKSNNGIGEQFFIFFFLKITSNTPSLTFVSKLVYSHYYY